MLGPVIGAVDLAAAIEEGWVTAASETGLGPVRRAKAKARASVLQVLGEGRVE